VTLPPDALDSIWRKRLVRQLAVTQLTRKTSVRDVDSLPSCTCVARHSQTVFLTWRDRVCNIRRGSFWQLRAAVSTQSRQRCRPSIQAHRVPTERLVADLCHPRLIHRKQHGTDLSALRVGDTNPMPPQSNRVRLLPCQRMISWLAPRRTRAIPASQNRR